MAFKPDRKSRVRPPAAIVTRMMAGIGMQFAVDESMENAPIEETLVLASEAGMIDHDLRVLSVLVTWLDTHHAYVNADRLLRLVREHDSERVLAFWAAVGDWLSSDRRFRRLQAMYDGPTIDLLKVGTSFQVKRHGEDQRFTNSPLLVPGNTLRSRSSDVLSPGALAAAHSGYRNRVLMGPSWRADVWSELASAPTSSPTELARRVGCAFATAWHAKRDFELLGRSPNN